jgi:hypothetical protein
VHAAVRVLSDVRTAHAVDVARVAVAEGRVEARGEQSERGQEQFARKRDGAVWHKCGRGNDGRVRCERGMRRRRRSAGGRTVAGTVRMEFVQAGQAGCCREPMLSNVYGDCENVRSTRRQGCPSLGLRTRVGEEQAAQDEIEI